MEPFSQLIIIRFLRLKDRIITLTASPAGKVGREDEKEGIKGWILSSQNHGTTHAFLQERPKRKQEFVSMD